MVFNEEQGGKRKGKRAENFSGVLRFALVLIKQYKARHEGLKVLLRRRGLMATWDTDVLDDILFGNKLEHKRTTCLLFENESDFLVRLPCPFA